MFGSYHFQAFYEALATFKGAAKRLEKLGESDSTVIYRDFAHAPSKVKATTEALQKQFPNRTLVACLELHTFSSLNKAFLPQYAGALNAADVPVVYFNPKTVEHKRMEMLDENQIKEAFRNPKVKVFTESKKLQDFLESQQWHSQNLLLMSSGNYDNLDFKGLAEKVL